jgi:hypothetical protein
MDTARRWLVFASRSRTPSRRHNDAAVSEWYGSPLVKKNPHPSSLSAGNFGKTLPCAFKDGFELLALHTRKVPEKS